MRIESREQLADLLRDAEAAHKVHEATHGNDVEWPEWYAAYIMGRLEAADSQVDRLLSDSHITYPAGSYASLFPSRGYRTETHSDPIQEDNEQDGYLQVGL